MDSAHLGFWKMGEGEEGGLGRVYPGRRHNKEILVFIEPDTRASFAVWLTFTVVATYVD